MKEEIHISYARQGLSKEGKHHDPIIDDICNVLEQNNYKVVIDKKELGYKDDIKKFEERLASGRKIILVVSDKFLKSPHCMYEMLKIQENGNVYERIFPIVLSDADIYVSTNAIKYVKHWEEQVEQVNVSLKSLKTANASFLSEDLENFEKIRWIIPDVVKLLKRMNTLTPDVHKETNFSALIQLLRGDRIRKATEAVDESEFINRISKISKLYDATYAIISKELKNQNTKDKEILERLKYWQNQCKNQTFSIGVMAMVKSGKSSFLNALLGNEFLPMSNVAETAIAVRIMHANEKDGKLLHKDNAPIHGALAINDHLKQKNKARRDKGFKSIPEYQLLTNLVVIEGQEMAGIKFEILDTPGLGEALSEVIVGKNINQSNEELLEKLSIIIYLLDYTKLKTESENEILNKLTNIRPDLLEKIQERLFFIVNKIDEEDRNGLTSDETTEYVYSLVLNKMPKLKKDQIFHLSARNALLSRLILRGNATEQAIKDFKTVAFGIRASKVNDTEIPNAANDLLELSKILEVEGKLINFLYSQRGRLLVDTLSDNLKRILIEFKNKFVVTAIGALKTTKEEIEELENKIEEAKKKQKNIQDEAEKFEIQIKKWIDGEFRNFEKKALDNIDSVFNADKAAKKKSLFNAIIPNWVPILQKKVLKLISSKSKSREETLETVEAINTDISVNLSNDFTVFKSEMEYRLYTKHGQLLSGLQQAINTMAREFEKTLNKALNINLEPVEISLSALIDFEKTLSEINSVMDRYVEKQQHHERVQKSESYYDPDKWCGLGGQRTRYFWETHLVNNFSISKSTIELHWKNKIETMNEKAKGVANHFVEDEINKQIQSARSSFDDYTADYLLTISTEKANLAEGGTSYIESRLQELEELERNTSALLNQIEL